MESIDLDMDDLFDVRGDIDEDAAFPPSPTGFGDNEAPENGGGRGSGGEGEENEEGEIQSQVIQKLRDMSKGAGKRVIRNPQPKLDADRLNGDRGIPILPKIFKEFKLKGPGHEIDDLNSMMRKMEHWAHRLYPKMTFDEVIERVERLGGKKAVQTTIKKIRLDIPLLDEEFVNGEDGEQKSGDEADDRKDESGDRLGYPDEVDLVDSDAENVLDEMIREDSTFTQPVGTPAPKGKPLLSELITPQDGEPSTPIPSQTPQSNSTNGTGASPVLTDEVKERIERNKRLALERRQARLKGLTPAKNVTLSNPSTPNSQAAQVGFSQPSQTLKDSQSTCTETPKGTEKISDQKSNEFPSEDDMRLFVDATMETKDQSVAKSKESDSEEKLHLFVEETMETEKDSKDRDAQPKDSIEKDVHLFIEPTMETEKGDAQAKSSSEALHLFVEPTIETDTHGSLKETESDPIESAMDDDFHLFIEETAATEQEGQMKEAKSQQGASDGTFNLFVNETEPMGESRDSKRNSGEGDEKEMTEGELHLFLEGTESVSCNVGVSGGSGEKADSADTPQKLTDQDNDEDELCLCIDSTEESQEEEEMDTGS